MMTILDPRNELEPEIRSAFAGVVLGGGTSLTAAEYADNRGKDDFGKDISPYHFWKSRKADVFDDWTSVALLDLERGNIAHIDAEGFRFYLPALMLSIISDYDPCSTRVIGTLIALCPETARHREFDQCSLLDNAQKSAVARFLKLLPTIVEIDASDKKTVERGFEMYWKSWLRE